MTIAAFRNDPAERPDRRRRTSNELQPVDMSTLCYLRLLKLATGEASPYDPLIPSSVEGAVPEQVIEDDDTVPLEIALPAEMKRLWVEVDMSDEVQS